MPANYGATANGSKPEKSEKHVQIPASQVPTLQGQAMDKRLDQHESYEFGGPWGVTAMMVFFPLLMYYLWICLKYYDGQLVYPTSVDDIRPFLSQMWSHVVTGAYPTLYAWQMYSALIAFQLGLAFVIPGYQQEGLPVPSLGYKTLMYNCNGLWCWYTTIIVVAGVQYFGIFNLADIIDNFGHLMTVAMIVGFVVSFAAYFITIALGMQLRMSGNFIYDVWMGAILNPRLGSIDLKMWLEVRIPWVLMWLMAVSGAVKQHQQYGYVTPNAYFMILATGLYINACAKGEELIPQTWDMYYEKWGFMVIFWNFAGVPFTYCYSVVYMSTHDPEIFRFSTIGYVALYTTLLTAYFIWDTAMAQKSHFKLQTQGIYKQRYTFPQLPWNTVKNPSFVQTAHGNRLLTSGWWQFARKINYTADGVQALTWGLVIWNATPIPYFYVCFFIAMLIHRCGRDFERCSIKYGKDWDRYCSIVKYKFIPGVY